MYFDLTIGNPPYQVPQETTGKRGGGADLWPDFVKKAFEILKKGMIL